MKTIKFKNGDLQFDIEKIKNYDLPISVSKEFDSNLDYPFCLDIEDNSYFYVNEDDRNFDYENLKTVRNDFTYSN